jgi:hypothetical protein
MTPFHLLALGALAWALPQTGYPTDAVLAVNGQTPFTGVGLVSSIFEEAQHVDHR